MSADEARREIAHLKAEQAPADDVERVKAWCEARVPARLRSEVRIECTRRGRSVTIVEARPLFRAGPGAEWTPMPIAQLRWDPQDGMWELYCADRNGRWWPYDDCGPTADIERMLRELEDDPTSIFWG